MTPSPRGNVAPPPSPEEIVPAAALVLAAGGSRRFGRPKQLADWGGRPLLERVVAAVASWPVARVVVVLGAHADQIIEQVDFGAAAVIINPEWDAGLASSLRVGFDLLSRDASLDWAFVALGDQPAIPPDVPRALLAEAAEADRPAIVPVYRYQRGNPVLMGRPLWSRVMNLEGDAGAAGLLAAHPGWVHEVRVDHAPPADIDLPGDLEDLP